ncbi:MAG: LruC domain-containing protein [Cytophagales bacterium]|nr:LruC domain-containing protein [Cytophagales bacterium]
MMKERNNYYLAAFTFLLGVFLFACSPEEESVPSSKMLDSEVPSDFNYETLKTIPTELTFTYSDLPMALERFELYADENGEDLLFTGVTDMEGNFAQDLVFPIDVESVYVKFADQPVSNGRTSGLISLVFSNILKHKFNREVKKVEIESIEIDQESGKCKWRVRNPFKEKLSIDYSLPKLGEKGRCEAPQGDSFFYTRYSTKDCGICNDQSEENSIKASFVRDGKTTIIEKMCKCFCKEIVKYYTWPSCNRKASFAFEDLWPNAGDYDMNDVVVETKFKIKYKIINFRTNVEELKIYYRVKYSGAGYHNGFGIQLPLKPDLVEGVTGTIDNSNVDLNYEPNGVESGQSLATVIVFEDTRDLVNQMEYHNPSEIQEVCIKFKTGVRLFDLVCKFPFNPFMFNSSDRTELELEAPVRSLEVHLPRKMPTDLADMSLFALGNENGDPKYLSNPGRYPWALLIPMSFEYPKERINIKDAYPRFEMWVASGGRNYRSWFRYPVDEKVIKN